MIELPAARNERLAIEAFEAHERATGHRRKRVTPVGPALEVACEECHCVVRVERIGGDDDENE